MNFIEQIYSKNPSLKRKEVEGILKILVDRAPLENNELVRLTGIPKETIRNFKQSVSFMLQTPEGDSIALQPEYQQKLKSLSLMDYSWSLLDLNISEIATKLKEFRTKHGLHPKREFDQFFATEESSVNKISALRVRDNINGKRIALLGDDDLLSVTLGYFLEKPTKIDVFDIDVDILNSVKGFDGVLNSNSTQCYQYDARKSLDKNFVGKYDVVVTDPPYTKAGIKLFLNRAIQLLDLSSKNDIEVGKYIYLYYGNSFKTPEKTLKIQEIIYQFGLVIEDKIDKFVRYTGAESIGSTSSLYILKATSSTKPLPEEILNANIYTFEDKSEEKFPFVDHIVAKVHKVPSEILNSKQQLLKIGGTLCAKHKLHVVDSKVTKFSKGGFTVTFILGTSNLLFHTWPEYAAVHIDLITCSPIYMKNLLPTTLASLFRTRNIEFIQVE